MPHTCSHPLTGEHGLVDDGSASEEGRITRHQHPSGRDHQDIPGYEVLAADLRHLCRERREGGRKEKGREGNDVICKRGASSESRTLKLWTAVPA